MKRRYGYFLVIGMLVVALDQGSKWLAQLAGLRVTFNTGMAFGIFSDQGQWVLAVTLVTLMAVVWWVLRQDELRTIILGSLFVGAGISNLLDRLWFEGVRDWLYVPILHVHNNLADWVLSLVVMYVVFREINLELLHRKVQS